MLKNALDCAFRNIDVSRIMLELEFPTLGHLWFSEISCMWHFLLFRQPLLLEYSTSADSRNINFLLNHSNQQIALFLTTYDPVFSAWAICPISLQPTERYFFTTNRLPFFHNLHIAHFSFNQLLKFFTTDRLPIIFQPIDRSCSTTDTSLFFHNLHITFFTTNKTFCT
jgi:hypothetical protein